MEEFTLRNRIHVFEDRLHGGELLANILEKYQYKKNTYVLAIPAGGVPVAYMISKRLDLPLDLLITRKLHIPWNKEAGFGAISWDGTTLFNEPLVASLGLTREDIARCVAEEKKAIKRRMKTFRGNRAYPSLENKTAIIVDDGLASGFSMLTTIKAIKKRKVKEKVVAVPTAPISAIERIKPFVDKIVCLNIRSGPIFAVADAYKVWYDLEDEDIRDVLQLARKEGLYQRAEQLS
ncbi:MAG: phosphoribosyltransferase [Candidatus Bathyarchaeota archaeon]|nr:MAG: phosphoribosyltransferase [Candidatus Bathyarchaeota archaeon]